MAGIQELLAGFSRMRTLFTLHVTDAVLEGCQTERVRLHRSIEQLEISKNEEILRIRQALDDVQAAAHAIGDQYHQVAAISQQQGAEIRAYQQAISEFSQHLDVLQAFHRERADGFDALQHERDQAVAEATQLRRHVLELEQRLVDTERSFAYRMLRALGRIPLVRYVRHKTTPRRPELTSGTPVMTPS